MRAAQLGPAARAETLERLRNETFDLAVVGGGVTGSGVALDAATRGMSVALVEQRDFAAGTSSRSSKLIHGGLRYLEQLNFALVREALKERSLLIRTIAPHIVHGVRFLYPIKRHGWERLYVGTGVALYDILAGTLTGKNALPPHRHLTRTGALREAPALKREALVGAIQYSDAQVDDARHTMMVARTAASYGAAVATSARVMDFVTEGERVAGLVVRDLEGGEDFTVRAAQVVNATGVWTDQVQDLVGRGRIKVQASKGIHLVVPRDRIHSDTGMILRTEKSVLFVIPWGQHWIIGTTDTAWDLDLAHPAASASDIDYLLDHVNAVLNNPLTTADVEGVYAGLRPLLTGESEATSTLSREHAVSKSVSGLITVAGGKYTTYRVMAKDAVDMAVHGLAQSYGPSVTDKIPLVGAEGYTALWNARYGLAERSGLHVNRIEHLLNRYGHLIHDILDLVAERGELADPLPGADGYIKAEVTYAASHEGALHLDDVLTRRTRISIETMHRGVESAKAVAELMGDVLGWDTETAAGEIEHYVKRVEAERESQHQPDDQTADSARLGAPDVRLGAA